MRAAQILDPTGMWGNFWYSHPDMLGRLVRYGVERVYAPATDPHLKDGLDYVSGDKLRAKLAELGDVRERNLEVGIFRDPSWDGLGAIQLARAGSADITNAGRSAADRQCAYLFDVETKDLAYIKTLFCGSATTKGWRLGGPTGQGLRPFRETGWTFEGRQGTVYKELLPLMAQLGIGLHPQPYYSQMEPIAPDRVALDLVLNDADPATVRCIYDGDLMVDKHGRVLSWWDGIIYGLERTPL